VRALLAQLSSAPGDGEANVAVLEAALEAHEKVELAVFPELFLCGYELDQVAELAIAADHSLIRRVRAAASRRSTAVIVGFAERTPTGTVANSAACIGADGDLVGVYRKTHLFGEAEQEAFEEGKELLLARLAGRLIAPLICFDVEFPEPARALCREGAQLLVTISANMAPYGPDHALAARARALENRRPHLYVNRVGEAHGLRFTGESAAIDRHGEPTTRPMDDESLIEVEVPEAHAVPAEADYLQYARGELPIRAVGLHSEARGERR